ncbi:alanyl-tRNA editing protein [Paenisporosarcina antarctica]|uniref:Alanyl-tRNA editing protein n=1 Tax=Paenisporosarcina antarctica TaxID=417367 RepID=A0A4P7A0L4_9BACL|nr:alanine--tRNA ligase-related protein [Paenisporosarcina antarctica]QBP42332.1 alanyl-tRNA editing protein [Paenisporosarcina antarctica]
MKRKLFYEDAYRQSGVTKVVSLAKDQSERWYVTLEETLFYPTGGGQPHDNGMINSVQVTDVEEVEGEIRHYLAKPLLEVGEAVNIEIDWTRRFDFMQQHAGQHILTASFVELFDIQTTSFHLGKELVTIDLDIKDITTEQLVEVEKRANQLILENRPIATKWVTKDELKDYPIRKQVAVEEDIRLVIIPEFDYNGCGGTHPSSTGQIAALKILDTEMQKGKIRVHFLCGGRVLQQLHRKQKTLQEVTHLLSAPEEGLALAVKVMLDNSKKLEKTLEETHEQLMNYEVKELLGEIQQECMSIERVFRQRPIQELQKIARLTVAQATNCRVIFIAENDGLLQLVLARGTENQTNMKQLIVQILPLINGKGGGSVSFAQGGGTTDLTGQQLLEEIHLF